MSERIQVLTHKGHKIVFEDSSNLKPNEIIALLPAIADIQIKEKCNLILHDISGTSLNDDVKKAAVESALKVKDAVGNIYSAFIGIRGIQKILANAMVRGQYFAATREEALDWLVKQVNK